MTMTKVIFTDGSLLQDIQLIKAYEAKEKELKELRETLQKGLQQTLENAGLEELQIGEYTVKLQTITRNNFQTGKFKEKYMELYKAFLKTSNYKTLKIS